MITYGFIEKESLYSTNARRSFLTYRWEFLLTHMDCNGRVEDVETFKDDEMIKFIGFI